MTRCLGINLSRVKDTQYWENHFSFLFPPMCGMAPASPAMPCLTCHPGHPLQLEPIPCFSLFPTFLRISLHKYHPFLIDSIQRNPRLSLLLLRLPELSIASGSSSEINAAPAPIERKFLTLSEIET